jgi:hypothetical protein
MAAVWLRATIIRATVKLQQHVACDTKSREIENYITVETKARSTFYSKQHGSGYTGKNIRNMSQGYPRYSHGSTNIKISQGRTKKRGNIKRQGQATMDHLNLLSSKSRPKRKKPKKETHQ